MEEKRSDIDIKITMDEIEKLFEEWETEKAIKEAAIPKPTEEEIRKKALEDARKHAEYEKAYNEAPYVLYDLFELEYPLAKKLVRIKHKFLSDAHKIFKTKGFIESLKRERRHDIKEEDVRNWLNMTLELYCALEKQVDAIMYLGNVDDNEWFFFYHKDIIHVRTPLYLEKEGYYFRLNNYHIIPEEFWNSLR